MKDYDFCEKDISGIGGGDDYALSDRAGNDAFAAMG